MSILDLSRNNLAGLTTLQGSEAYQTLRPQERQVLERYSALQQAGNLNGRTVRDITGIQELALGREYGGAGTVEFAAQSLNTDGVEVLYFIGERPYLFFANPANGDFYFMRNTNPLDNRNSDIEVLEVRTGQWVHVDNPAEFFGPALEEQNYTGLIKANFVVTQFSQDATRVHQERDEIVLRVAEESLNPKKRGELYFHERQKGGLCQLHAANAFLGYPAIRPNALAEYMTSRAPDFGLQNVEGLAAGGQNQGFEEIAEGLGNGLDLGTVVDYMRHVAAEGNIRVNIDNLQVGELDYSDEEGLVFTNFVTGDIHKVDDAFLNGNSRAMIGTLSPVHATAARKNTDGSWSTIDAFQKNQTVHEDYSAALIATIQTQKATVHHNITLPCAFL